MKLNVMGLNQYLGKNEWKATIGGYSFGSICFNIQIILLGRKSMGNEKGRLWKEVHRASARKAWMFKFSSATSSVCEVAKLVYLYNKVFP